MIFILLPVEDTRGNVRTLFCHLDFVEVSKNSYHPQPLFAILRRTCLFAEALVNKKIDINKNDRKSISLSEIVIFPRVKQ